MYPKPETTVIFSSIRTIAKVVGLFAAAPLNQNSPSDLKLNPFKSIPAALVMTFIQWQLILYTPKMFKLLIFYAYTFVVYATMQYTFLSIIPKYCANKKDQKNVKPKEN